MDDINFGLDLSRRLSALEARAPVQAGPPSLHPGGRRHSRFAVPIALAPILVLATVATVAGGAIVVRGLVTGREGIQNPGRPLAGAHMECMTPREAASFLAAHGYPDVVWQIEAGNPGTNGKGETTTTQQAAAPDHGYVVPGTILDDGRPIMIVDQRVGASGVGACHGMPMP